MEICAVVAILAFFYLVSSFIYSSCLKEINEIWEDHGCDGNRDSTQLISLAGYKDCGNMAVDETCNFPRTLEWNDNGADCYVFTTYACDSSMSPCWQYAFAWKDGPMFNPQTTASDCSSNCEDCTSSNCLSLGPGCWLDGSNCCPTGKRWDSFDQKCSLATECNPVWPSSGSVSGDLACCADVSLYGSIGNYFVPITTYAP